MTQPSRYGAGAPNPRRPTVEARRVTEGDRLSAREYNLIRDAVGQIIRESRGFATPLTQHLPVAAVTMVVKSTDGDYFTCRRYDGTNEFGGDVYVAKPFELRPSITALGPQTYAYTNDAERVATEGADNETQVIAPPWYLNETVIWATRARRTLVTGPSSEELRWIDLNLAGRAWAKKAGT